MAVVAYLLGAGASAECIPVVNGMAEDMPKIIQELDPYFPTGKNQSDPVHILRQDHFVPITKIFKHLSYICKTHFSIDTYAKKLYLKDKGEFKQLKLDLCLYFTLRQLIKTPDKRYDNFFASIINERGKLPRKIKILSWNYDFQLESTFANFSDATSIGKSNQMLGVISPNSCSTASTLEDRFNVIKFNGSAKFNLNDFDDFLITDSQTEDKQRLIHGAVAKYFELKESLSDLNIDLKFAWEQENDTSLFDCINGDLSRIQVLVVIGYSFPFFNRQVDSLIFKKMPSLKKIYIQDPNPEGIQETMSEFVEFWEGTKDSIEVVLKRNTNQFVFPIELDVVS
jgi:hypothetical protein